MLHQCHHSSDRVGAPGRAGHRPRCGQGLGSAPVDPHRAVVVDAIQRRCARRGSVHAFGLDRLWRTLRQRRRGEHASSSVAGSRRIEDTDGGLAIHLFRREKIGRHFELADFREQGIAFGARDKLICVIQILLNRTGKTFIESIGFVVLLRHGANS